MPKLDETHDPGRASWVASANQPGGDFPIQNLPYGVFRRRGEAARGGVAIGAAILDLGAAHAAGLFAGPAAEAAAAASGPALNPLLALGPAHWSALRRALSRLLAAGGADEAARRRDAEGCLLARDEAELLLPVAIGDYTDFYASLFHATNVGRQFRPENPLLPNYKWVPIGYHGRASSIVISGTPVRRPYGQVKAAGEAEPRFAACRMLDYELELGGIIGGPGNPLGTAVPIEEAGARLFGFCLVNDWSARDIQAWEYQPLGPFLAKSFATSLSPWIITAEALAPFRCPAFRRDAGDPAPLAYLASDRDAAEGGLDIAVEAQLRSPRMRAAQAPPIRLSRGNARDLYWTFAQMLAHHAGNGCNLNPGDLIASGTISGPDKASWGSLIELTARGRDPVALPDGETRGFLEDGDEVILTASCRRDGCVPIGFGACRGTVLAAE